MIHLEVIMVVKMVVLLVKVVLIAALFWYLISSFVVKPHKPKSDKSDGIVKDESGDIISIDGIPFDEYMERL